MINGCDVKKFQCVPFLSKIIYKSLQITFTWDKNVNKELCDKKVYQDNVMEIFQGCCLDSGCAWNLHQLCNHKASTTCSYTI